eukprot:CAMPEP_0168722686 /NCGR_PEP_ID=MMETSP0724-20121128/2725_1 /TAXON_ID=265536 /ORGANISM="Amphiprora sp., Strain CCMP467" /LENGTH=505 /DNA_ID=CAMNT_0008769365 /DNA_START=22 /DNA_END=1539 /DNA_ORIENTATION=+
MATTVSDEKEIVATLKQWSQERKLHEAKLSPEGLTLGQTLLENKKLSLDIVTENGPKSAQYTLASIYLQLLDPNQKLLAYRKACKTHNVNDPVAVSDKDGVISHLMDASATVSEAPPAQPAEPAAAAAAAAATTATTEKPLERANDQAASAPPQPPKDKEVGESAQDKRRDHHKSSRGRDRHKDRKRSSSGKDRGRGEEKSAHKKKKVKEVVTTEELFTNLNEVVGKRVADSDVTKAEIIKALKADGFEFNAETLENCRESAQHIFENEIPVGNSASILRAANPRKDLSRVLEIFNEVMNPRKSSSARGGRGVPPPPPGKPTLKRPYLLGKNPVIIVPKGMTAPVTLVNAQEFFANGNFVPRDIALKQGRGQRGNQKITFTRQVRVSTGSGPVEFEIIDNPKKLGTNLKDWDRIVAVVALGQSWQFKDWYNQWSDPVQLFSRSFGFYLSMEGDRIPQDVGTWSVKKAKLNRDKRGLDTIAFASFWNGLDEWMTVHRRELLPQGQD